MTRVPSALWIIDTNKEHIAVSEAHKLNIPVVAILDTNCDPDVVDWPVPGNDDAIRSTALLSRVISTAVEEGKKAREERALAASKEAAGDTEEKAVADAEKAAEATSAEAVEAPAAETAEVPEATEAPAAETAEATEAPAAEGTEN